MKKLMIWAALFAGVAMLPSCLDDKDESCSVPEITAVNYLPKNPTKSDEVTVTAKIRNEHCPFQACVTYQVAKLDAEWSFAEESYKSTAFVHSSIAGETYDFTAKIPATGLTGRKVHFVIEVITQHFLYVTSEWEEYIVPGPIEPDPNPDESGESGGSGEKGSEK